MLRDASIAVVALLGCGRIGFDEMTDSGPFCATRIPAPAFCEDFDHGMGTAAWEFDFTDRGMFRPDAVAARSLPSGLLVATDQLPTSADVARAYVEHRVSTTRVTRATMSFDVMALQLGSGEVLLAQLALIGATQVHDINFVYTTSPATAFVENAITPNGGTALYDIIHFEPVDPIGWHRIELVIVTEPTTTVAVTYDGRTVLDAPFAGAGGGAPKLRFGAPFLRGPAMPWQIALDNLVLELPEL